MKSVSAAFVNVWRHLDWFDRVIAGLFVGGFGFSAFTGDVMGTTWYGVVLVLWCSTAYWRNTALNQRAEIKHLRTALRDTVAPGPSSNEFTIQKPIAYQVTVGGKAPSSVEAAEWAVKDAEREVEYSQFRLTRARENAANELRRLTEMLEKEGDR
ncbi:hypothetical protein [Prescottella agglutinans]|uniref:Uncharacterized protein n=1 Tax=Prescottella agglutinans TaxID=1644129 RepID=A0ABT6MHN3_9NOCA|nr:hypothetical protein [Prescottella agglutinans]MDH6282864.1 hypothetical protein [Prescottella agglutinans]